MNKAQVPKIRNQLYARSMFYIYKVLEFSLQKFFFFSVYQQQVIYNIKYVI